MGIVNGKDGVLSVGGGGGESTGRAEELPIGYL